MIWTLFILLFLVGTTPKAFCTETPVIQLFQNGSPVESYSYIVRTLKPGDRVRFSRGEEFEVKKFLGAGDRSVVWALSESKALRFPKASSRIDLIAATLFHEGYPSLLRSPVPLVRVDLEQSVPPEFAVVERVPDHPTCLRVYTLEDLEESLSQGCDLDPIMLDALFDFAKTTAMFAEIGDFHAGQLVWSADRWILADWSVGHVQSHGHPQASIFTPMLDTYNSPNPRVRRLYHKLHLAVLEERESNICEQTLREAQ